MKRILYLTLLSLTALVGWAGAHEHGGLADMPGALTNAQPITNISLFVWPLLVPSNAVPAGFIGTNLVYDMRMRTNSHQFHLDLPPVPIWGYSDSASLPGLSPGPTIQATSGVPVYVLYRSSGERVLLPEVLQRQTLIDAIVRS